MGFSTNIAGGTSGTLADVDANKNLLVRTPQTKSQSGYVTMMGETDDGSITGTKDGYSPFVSDERRLSVGMDTMLMNETFNMTAQNTSLWRYVTATQTVTWNTSGLILNATASGVTGTGTAYSSYRNIPIVGGAPVRLDMKIGVTSALQANQIFEFGLFPFGAGTAAPTDGVYFRLTSAGLIGVVNFNGTETTTAALTFSPVANQLYNMTLYISESEVYLYRDGVRMGALPTPAANGQPFVTTSLPVTFQSRNPGTVSGTVATLRVTDVACYQREIALVKPYPHQMAAIGQNAHQGQNGGTLGTTALYPNATAATTVTGGAISQTTAIATGLGGQAGIVANTPGADGLITSFQVPAGGINQTPRTLFITGVRISSCNIGAAVATTASTLQWSISYGATAAALTTAAGVAAKAHVRFPLGIQSWAIGAAVGASAQDIVHTFQTPIVVNPGEFICSVAKFIQGTATASQVIWCVVGFEGYWQ